MSDTAARFTPPIPAKAKRERSPSFPFISLKAALNRLVAFDDYSKRHPIPAKYVGQAWGMKGYSSQAQQTLAALKSFGLIEYRGSGDNLFATTSDDARTYLRAQQDSVKQEVIKRIALKPKALSKYFPLWGTSRPPDPICLDQLILKDGFNDAAARLFLSVYDDTIVFAGLDGADRREGEQSLEDNPGLDVNPPNPPPAHPIRIGDYVQWTSSGIDQLNPPRKVVGFTPDGAHAQIFGYNGALPIVDLRVVEPPAHPVVTPKHVEGNSAWVQGENDFNVLQRGNRLQITADVDLAGLEELKEMLGHYEAILKLREARNRSS